MEALLLLILVIFSFKIKMGDESKKASTAKDELYYMPPRIDFGGRQEEGFREKFSRKLKQNAFVPIGLAATTIILSYGLWQMKTGNKVMSQRMMRARIIAQGLTIGAVLIGVAMGTGAE